MERKRRSRFDLPQVIPVFPLPGALLLPRGRLPLNIFEPRYLAMVDQALRTTRVIGMIQPCGGNASRPDLFPVGCLGRLTAWSETDDGRFLITLTGIARFQVCSEVEAATPYRQIEANYKAYPHDLEESEDGADIDRERLATSLKCYLRQQEIGADWSLIERAPAEMLINYLAMICPFDVAEKQGLLEARTLCERANMLTTLIEMAAAADSGAESGGTLQ